MRLLKKLLGPAQKGEIVVPPFRERVIEHRVTRHLNSYMLRFWIESDPVYNGVTKSLTAATIVDNAIRDVPKNYTDRGLAEWLIDHIYCANSVEVVDPAGNGVTVHRDWP